jgi:hypothetical protein
LHLRAGGLVIFLVFLLGSTSTYNIGGYWRFLNCCHPCCKGALMDPLPVFEGTKDCFFVQNAFIALQGRVNAAPILLLRRSISWWFHPDIIARCRNI